MSAFPLFSPPQIRGTHSQRRRLVLRQARPPRSLARRQTSGDNLEAVTGVASGTVMGASRHLTAAFTVLLLGQPATRLASTTLQSSTNVSGARIVPSQVKVLLLAPRARRAARCATNRSRPA